MKILFLSHLYPNNINPSFGMFIHNKIKQIVDAGHQVRIIAPVPYVPKILKFKPKWLEYSKIKQHNIIDGVRINYTRYLNLPGARFHPISCYTMYYGIQPVLNSLMEKFKPDILHTNTATPDGFVGVLIKKKYKIPLISSLRGSDINIYPHRDKFTMLLTKKVISDSDQVISVSKDLSATAEKITSPKKKIKVIYNGCDLNIFSFNKHFRLLIRKKLNISDKAKVIIFIGQVEKSKGVYELIKSFNDLAQKYSDLHLIIAGNRLEEPSLDYLVSGNLKNRIHFAGRQPYKEIPHFLSAADVFVLPSYNEGLPNVVLEAMACGLPVVATKVGGIPEAVEHGKSGFLVNKKDVKSLTNYINILLNDEDLAIKMGAYGRNIIKCNFSWIKNSEEIIETYHELLAAN